MSFGTKTKSDQRTDGSLFLTFDDGPHLSVTPRVLHILGAHCARAAFFVVGNKLRQAGAIDILAQAVADGHTIGNHTLTHRDLTLRSEREIEHELTATAMLLKPLGIQCTFFRPPYGRTNSTVSKVVKKLGYKIVLWDNDPRDWESASQQDWANTAIEAVIQRGARVIVCHDTHETTADQLNDLLSRLSEHGYFFASLEELQGELVR